MKQDKVPRRIFGFQEEWIDFEVRNARFFERLPNFEKAYNLAFGSTMSLSEVIDKVVLMYGRVCLEDFFEILLCSGNGDGLAAQKLLRGLYERAVTLRYLHEHPTEVQDFLDYHLVAQRKLMLVCKETMGEESFTPEMSQQIEAEYQAVKDKFMVTECKECGTTRLNFTWSKYDFVSMARATCLGKLLAVGYYIPLRNAHATVASMLSRMEAGKNGGISFAGAAQRKEADYALRVSHNIILDALRVEDERFAVPGLKEQNEMCLQDFIDIWQKPSTP